MSIFVLKEAANAMPLCLNSDAPSIVFDNVHFGYEPGFSILKGLSFEVPSGKKIAIVGGSGSG